VSEHRSSAALRRRRLTAAVVILCGAVLALAVGVRLTHADRVLPGVRVEGVELGGATRDEVGDRLDAVVRRAAEEPVTLVAEDRRETIAPHVAGYFVDLDTTADRALASGRSGPVGGLWSTISGLLATREVSLAQTVDRVQLGRSVATVAGRLGREAFPGELVIEPGTLAISTKPPRSGRLVDRPKLEQRLRAALVRRPRAPVQVPLRAQPVASRAAVDAVGRAARAFLGQPLRLTGAGEPFEVSPGRMAGVLALVSRAGGRGVRLGVGDARLATLVDEIAAKRDRPARSARIDTGDSDVKLDAKGDASWRPREVKVRVLEPARSGRTVKRAELATAIESTIREDRHSVRLPTEVSEPAMSADGARAVHSLIGTFTTYYVAGQPRVTNIRRIAADVDGTVVAPGARFSLNEIAGERTKAKGYVEAPYIAEGKIEPSIGGGVSQFSTTLYNAAYFAGLQIDGHRPHSFFIDRYPAGREATVNYPDIDMTWTNDTDTPVLIRTKTDEGAVTVRLYGDNGGRRVRAQSGEHEPLTEGDFAITVTRVVRYADGKEQRQPFTTRYDKPPADE
jgi:vancomycin resistance protein YoaR